MSGDVDELTTRIATLETERDALIEATKPLSKKALKEERRVSMTLATTKEKIRVLELKLQKNASTASTDETNNDRASSWLKRAGTAGIAACALPLIYAYATGSDDVRWVGTTCTAREIVASDGEGLGTVSIPELRPEWQIDSTKGEAGPCWIPVPETSREIVHFSEPADVRVSRWEQVGTAPRVLSVLMLWGSIALLYVAGAIRRGVELLPLQRADD